MNNPKNLTTNNLRLPSADRAQRNLILTAIEQLETGFSEVMYHGHKYAVTKKVFNDGKSIKVFAKSTADSNFISFKFV